MIIILMMDGTNAKLRYCVHHKRFGKLENKTNHGRPIHRSCIGCIKKGLFLMEQSKIAGFSDWPATRTNMLIQTNPNFMLSKWFVMTHFCLLLLGNFWRF